VINASRSHAEFHCQTARAELAAKRVSSVEVTQYFIKRINALGKALNAFISVDEEQSLTSHALRTSCWRRAGEGR